MVPQLAGVWKGLGVFTRPGRCDVHAAQNAHVLKRRFCEGTRQYSRSLGQMVQLPKNIDDIENIELGIYDQPPASHEDTNIIAATAAARCLCARRPSFSPVASHSRRQAQRLR